VAVAVRPLLLYLESKSLCILQTRISRRFVDDAKINDGLRFDSFD
jgi:hypothetical protein